MFPSTGRRANKSKKSVVKDYCLLSGQVCSFDDSTVSNLNHLFLKQPFSTPWKHQETLGFSVVFGGRERVHWERMVKQWINENESHRFKRLIKEYLIVTKDKQLLSK